MVFLLNLVSFLCGPPHVFPFKSFWWSSWNSLASYNQSKTHWTNSKNFEPKELGRNHIGLVEPINWIRPKGNFNKLNFLPNKSKYTLSYKFISLVRRMWSRRIERVGRSKLFQKNLTESDVELFMNLKELCHEIQPN